MRGHFLFIVIAIALLSAIAGIAAAATVTQDITYQGRLTDAGGNPLSGTYSLTFKLYDVSSGGTVLATFTNSSVQCSNGLFTTLVTFDSSFFDGRALWLGITVGADSEMTPRQEIRPVPYAIGLRPGAVINGSGFGQGDVLKVINDKSGGGNAINITTKQQGTNGIRINTTNWASAGVIAETWGSDSAAIYAIAHSPQSNAVYGSTDANGPAAIAGTTTGSGSYGVYANTIGSGSHGVYAATSGSGSHGVRGFTTGPESYGVYGESLQDAGIYGKGVWGGYFRTNQKGNNTFLPTGIAVLTGYDYNRGINAWTLGSNSPGLQSWTDGSNSYGLDVWTSNASSYGIKTLTEGPGSYGIYVQTTGSGSTGVWAETQTSGSAAVYGHTHGDTSYGVMGDATGPNSYGVSAYSAQSHGVYAHTGDSNSYGIYTPDRLYAGGGVFPSSDVAEYMPITENVTPGTVLIIGGDGKLLESNKAKDTRVAGIVSTAPGVTLGSKGGGNLGEAIVAVAGRVPCKVDATNGPIHPGDLLTTSDRPGYAMKANDPKIGTVLGKALGTLESGTGTIEVLVTLQ